MQKGHVRSKLVERSHSASNGGSRSWRYTSGDTPYICAPYQLKLGNNLLAQIEEIDKVLQGICAHPCAFMCASSIMNRSFTPCFSAPVRHECSFGTCCFIIVGHGSYVVFHLCPCVSSSLEAEGSSSFVRVPEGWKPPQGLRFQECTCSQPCKRCQGKRASPRRWIGAGDLHVQAAIFADEVRVLAEESFIMGWRYPEKVMYPEYR